MGDMEESGDSSTARRNLRKLAVQVGVAAAGVAVVTAITWPMSATGDGPARGTGSSAGGMPGPVAEAPGNAPGRYVAPAPAQDRGTGRDPLTDAERETAVRAALSGDRPLRTESKDVTGHAGDPQLLTSALAEDTDDRTAEVTFYDYTDNSLVVKTVDLATRKVTDTEVARGAQPPPSPRESKEAAKLLIGDQALGDGLSQDYRAATGKALTEVGQLEVRGGTYKAGPGAPAELRECGEHRCVRLFTRVKGGPWIETRQYVIDLSDRKVHRA
ncbi:hypothetical protein [Streptomyces boninensis]|uniref:hypothetical protein n=1 Tax=Streptomyces boninensis TaxID=2039455 RepID=UPI003B21A80C